MYLVLSLLFVGLGVSIYLQSEIAPNPLDRSMLIVSHFTGFNFIYSRAFINITLVLIAFFFNGAIGKGTLFHAVVTGLFISLFLPSFKQWRNNVTAVKRVRESG